MTQAEKIARKSGSNLAFVFFSLPKQKRIDISTFYAFCRLVDDIAARLAYTVAMFNICQRLFHRLHPDEPAYKMSIAEFSL